MGMTVDELVEAFELFDDWEERYAYLLDLGRKLPPFPDGERVEANKVRGCMSQVWLVHQTLPGSPGRLHFQGDSDAHLVKGLIGLLMQLYDEQTPEAILALDGEEALRRLGLTEFLSAQRRNGLVSMLARIRQIAEAEARAA
jgi:cysteine desulfuration protein SufE